MKIPTNHITNAGCFDKLLNRCRTFFSALRAGVMAFGTRNINPKRETKTKGADKIRSITLHPYFSSKYDKGFVNAIGLNGTAADTMPISRET